MGKNYLGWFFLLFLAHVASGQHATEIEVLYLKNGSIIKGIVLHKDTVGTVDIYTAEGHTFSYSYEEVLKIMPYVTPPPRNLPYNPLLNKPTERKGLYMFAKAGILPHGLYSFYASFGYRINSQIHLGVGIGYDSYPDIQYGIIPNFVSNQIRTRDGFMPVYLDSRFFLNKEPTAMFIYLNLGYSWPTAEGQSYTRDNPSQSTQTWYRTSSGGAFAVTGFGLKFHVTKMTAMCIDLGIRVQNYQTDITTRFYNTSINQFANSSNVFDKTALTPCWGLGVIF